jgi:integrase
LECTKTESGLRDVPMGAMLRQWLLEWKLRCPRRAGELYRVFSGHGRLAAWPKTRMGGGGAMSYTNFRRRIWIPGLQRAGVPIVTPHSARHFFVSTLQAQGVEVGLVAKLAGHANPNVTLGHYTQAVRGGAEAIQLLEASFGA